MDKVFYAFPEAVPVHIAARAYLEAAGWDGGVQHYIDIKKVIAENGEVFIPRPMAVKLMKKFGGEMHEMPAAGAVT